MARKKERLELYGTRQVAAILDIPEWRVKNFSEGEAYRLPPSVRVGSGRGSRRLYSWEDIFRIGLADRLVRFGFTPEAVGQAVREVPESTFAPYREYLLVYKPQTEGALKRKETPLLVNSDGIWRLKMASGLGHIFSERAEHGGSSKGLFIINVANVCDAVFSDLYRYWTGLSKEEMRESQGE